MFPLTAPEPLKSLRFTFTLGFVDGLLGFYGFYQDVDLETYMVVIWNPSVRKCVGIVIPNVLHSQVEYTHGIIYWLSHGRFIISFDLKSDKFGEVCLPERSKISIYELRVVKVNQSLGLLEYYEEGGMALCCVWMRKNGVNKPFTKIYNVKVEDKSVLNRVLGFRNNVSNINDPHAHIGSLFVKEMMTNVCVYMFCGHYVPIPVVWRSNLTRIIVAAKPAGIFARPEPYRYQPNNVNRSLSICVGFIESELLGVLCVMVERKGRLGLPPQSHESPKLIGIAVYVVVFVDNRYKLRFVDYCRKAIGRIARMEEDGDNACVY
nr:hypothetical protein [Tanacetum cinerariifolium]